MPRSRVALGVWIGIVAVLFAVTLCCTGGWLFQRFVQDSAQGVREVQSAAIHLLPSLAPKSGAVYASEDELAADLERRGASVNTDGLLLFLAIERPDSALRVVRDDGVSDVHRRAFERFLARSGLPEAFEGLAPDDAPRLVEATDSLATPFQGHSRVWFREVLVGDVAHRAVVGVQTAD